MEENKIQWPRIGAIVAVQGTFTLSWVIYSLYLPDLLVQLGFSELLAGTLLIIENGLEAAIEPICGSLSDRSFRNIGTREPWIKLGVILASASFIILPPIAFFVSDTSILRWSFPILAVFWASAMAIFRSPVMALLRLATPDPKLPIAASYITLVQQLFGAFRFTAYNAIVSVGPFFTFAFGSFILLGSAAFLRRVMPPITPQNNSQTLPKISLSLVAIVVSFAIAIGLSLRFLFASLTQILVINDAVVGSGLLGFSIMLAGFAIPAGWLAFYFSNTRVVVAGLILTAILLKLISSTASISILLIGTLLMAFAFSTVLNGIVPFVLELFPEQRAGLGVGVYFGGFGGALSFFDLFFSQTKNLNLLASFGAISLIVACFFVLISSKLQKSQK